MVKGFATNEFPNTVLFAVVVVAFNSRQYLVSWTVEHYWLTIIIHKSTLFAFKAVSRFDNLTADKPLAAILVTVAVNAFDPVNGWSTRWASHLQWSIKVILIWLYENWCIHQCYSEWCIIHDSMYSPSWVSLSSVLTSSVVFSWFVTAQVTTASMQPATIKRTAHFIVVQCSSSLMSWTFVGLEATAGLKNSLQLVLKLATAAYMLHMFTQYKFLHIFHIGPICLSFIQC